MQLQKSKKILQNSWQNGKVIAYTKKDNHYF